MDSITKADGMGDVRLVHFPGSVRVVLDDNALEFTADDSGAVADNRMYAVTFAGFVVKVCSTKREAHDFARGMRHQHPDATIAVTVLA
jgi:hypothetical protein